MKLEKIDKAFQDNKLARDVAYMIATSHEYKKPNEDAAIKLVSNYNWEKRIMKVSDLQGINKPVIKEKVYNIAKTLNVKTATPLMVVNKFQGITPQSPGKKILLDGHHRKEAYEFLGVKEIPVYYGKYTGASEKTVSELIDKKASEILGSLDTTVYYHASPVQGIKKFRLSEDTSGNNKGKVLFASKYPSFSAAFGLRWNDGIARLEVNTKDGKAPTSENYTGCVLAYTDELDLEKPCSMYRIRGSFKPLRYPKDVEVITNTPDIQIVSEEQFNSFRDMAKAYNLKLKKVSDKYIDNKLKTHKTSNFEKQANSYLDEIERMAGGICEY